MFISIQGTMSGVLHERNTSWLCLRGDSLEWKRSAAKQFCTNLRTFCSRAGIAIVADEILTGFRCQCNPTVLLSDQVNLQPDFITLAHLWSMVSHVQDQVVDR